MSAPTDLIRDKFNKPKSAPGPNFAFKNKKNKFAANAMRDLVNSIINSEGGLFNSFELLNETARENLSATPEDRMAENLALAENSLAPALENFERSAASSLGSRGLINSGSNASILSQGRLKSISDITNSASQRSYNESQALNAAGNAQLLESIQGQRGIMRDFLDFLAALSGQSLSASSQVQSSLGAAQINAQAQRQASSDNAAQNIFGNFGGGDS